MMRRYVEVALWSASGILLIAAFISSSMPTEMPPDASTTAEEFALPQFIDPGLLVNNATIAIDKNPFRLTRRPSAVAFGQDPAPPQTEATGDVGLSVTLAGIIGGPPWEAILLGMPGARSGVLVQRGDTVGGYHVLRITSDSITIMREDTTLVLALDDPR